MNKSLISSTLVLLLVFINISSTSPASILDEVGDKLKSGGNVFSNFCLTNDACYKDFFSFNNYCCKAQCCNWFSFVFDSE